MIGPYPYGMTPETYLAWLAGLAPGDEVLIADVTDDTARPARRVTGTVKERGHALMAVEHPGSRGDPFWTASGLALDSGTRRRLAPPHNEEETPDGS